MARFDGERILIKLDEMDGYMRELVSIAPDTYEEYLSVEKKRACERLLQLTIECMIDICHVLVTGLRLGLPAEENDLFSKLTDGNIISLEMGNTLREMKGFRNILVHDYARIDDQLVYAAVKSRMSDFAAFANEVRTYIYRATATIEPGSRQ